jgi:hypothetical protein
MWSSIGELNRYRRLRPLVAAEFSTMPASGLFTLPSWLAIACATTGRTTQTSASTVVSGIGANAARARNIGSGCGLSVENARGNLAKYSSVLSQWTPFTTTIATDSTVAPDGTTTADTATWSTGTSYANGQGSSPIGPACVISIWALKSGATTPVQLFDGQAGAYPVKLTLSTSWARYECKVSSATAAVCTTGFGNLLGGVAAGSAVAWGAQIETDSAYPTSFLPNAGNTQLSRAADVLSIASPSLVAPGGFFKAELVVAPNYASTEFTGDHDLLYFGANDRLFIRQSDKKLVLRIGGADVASAALTWAREQPISIRASHTKQGRALAVLGATTGNGSASAGAVSGLTLPGTAYLLGNSSGAQESASLMRVRFLQ